MLTREVDAFKKLCEVLPLVLDDVIKNQTSETVENSVFKELSDIALESLLKSLYLLSFQKYDGFENLQLD